MKNGEIVDYKADELVYDAWAGSDIRSCIKDILFIASNLNKRVRFEFNGIPMIAHPGEKAEDVYNRWNDATEARSRAYFASNEYKQSQAQRANENRKDQEKVDALMVAFPEALKDQKKLCKWFYDITPYVDNINIRWDMDFVSKNVKNAGYKSSAGVISKELSPQSKKLQEEILCSNRILFGNYLIGQSLSCMDHGLPPHHVFQRFYEETYVPLCKAEMGIA